MIVALGWLNLVLIIFMVLIYPLKRMYLKKRKPELLALYKSARNYHPLLGFTIILIGLIHGFMALGTIRLHTGTLVLFTVILMGCITTFGRKKVLFSKTWLKLHKTLIPLLFVFIIIHIFFRNII